MFHILLHNILIFITIFPGIFLPLMNKISIFDKLTDMDKYILCLAAIISINLLRDINLLFILLIIIITPIIIFFIEYIFKNINDIKINQMKFFLFNTRQSIYVMVLFPIFEEVIYREFIYYFFYDISNNIIFYCIISVYTFVFSHFFNQGNKCMYKIPFALVEAIIFFEYRNIILCIIIHMIFNILVYVYNNSKYDKRFI